MHPHTIWLAKPSRRLACFYAVHSVSPPYASFQCTFGAKKIGHRYRR